MSAKVTFAVMQLEGQQNRNRVGVAGNGGTLRHAVEVEPHIEVAGDCQALCGAKDGPNSFGFVRAKDPAQQVTCRRCCKKLEARAKAEPS